MADLCLVLYVLVNHIFISILCKNAIVIENEKPGSPNNEWDINGAGDPSIQGYAYPFSSNIGESIQLRINTTAEKWKIEIFRVGYYQANGARKIETFIHSKPSIQPDCIQLPKWRTVTCKNWKTTQTFDSAKHSLISGVYFARLTRLDVNNSSHPHYNWRIDNSQIGALSQFCEEECDSKPKASKHSYGASGYGAFRHKLKEPYASHIYFIIRDDANESDLLFQTSDTTWHAYNRFGGASTYGSFNEKEPKERALKMSYNRPIVTRDYRSINMLFSAEYPAIRWLEKNGFDVSYISGLDMSAFYKRPQLEKHKVFLSVGHDEYWSWNQRELVKNAIQNDGVHAMFWSGNEKYWKIRFEADFIDNEDKDEGANPRMVIFKETRRRSVKIDNESTEWTGTWRDEHFGFSEGPMPENEITGQLYTVDVWRSDPLHIPWYFSKHLFWRNCKQINKLEFGQTYVLKKPSIGHEFDEDIDNGFRPNGLQHLSETTIDNVQYLQDMGIIYDTGTAQHHLTLYKDARSNALVFGAGSIMFSWALDDFHDSATGIPPHLENYYDCRALQDGYGQVKELQQAMFNLFADMNVSKPESMNVDEFVFEKYKNEMIGQPKSWIYRNDLAQFVFDKYDDGVVGADKVTENGLQCIRIEGSSRVIDGNGIISGIEIFVKNDRWYAAIIDYDKILSYFENIHDVNEWFWYFEAWIGVNNDGSLFVRSRSTNDNGDIEDADEKRVIQMKGSNLNPCVQKDWTWRKRPLLLLANDENDIEIKTEL